MKRALLKLTLTLFLVTVAMIPVVVYGQANEIDYSTIQNAFLTYIEKIGLEEKVKNGDEDMEEPVASIDDIEIYKADIESEKAEMIQSGEEVPEEYDIIVLVAKEKLIIGEATEAGFGISDTEFNKILTDQYSSYDKNLAENESFAKEIGMSREEIITITAHRVANALIIGNYRAYLFTSLVSGDIITENKTINAIIDKYRNPKDDAINSFADDFFIVIDLYTEDLFKQAEMIIYDTQIDILPTLRIFV